MFIDPLLVCGVLLLDDGEDVSLVYARLEVSTCFFTHFILINDVDTMPFGLI